MNLSTIGWTLLALVGWCGSPLTHAFGVHELRDIAREVLDDYEVNITFTGIITFTEMAKRDLVRAVGRLDRTIAGRRRINRDWSFWDERLEDASERLVLLKESTVTALTGNNPDANFARRNFGRAIHTMMDFYSNTNWIELGNTDINYDLGLEILDDPAPDMQFCNGDNYVDTSVNITSAYKRCRRTPSGKCCRRAIAKEDSSVEGFETARAMAKNATLFYLDQLVAAAAAEPNGDAGIRIFMDRYEAIIFVIDITESMRAELFEIKDLAEGFITRFSGTQRGRYVLIAFSDENVFDEDEDNDDAIQVNFETADPQAFLAQIQALEADGDGEGDCREAGLKALRTAVDTAAPRSNIYYWSDAAQKAIGNFGAIGVLIRRPIQRLRLRLRAVIRRVRINLVLTGRCFPFGTSYRYFKRLARATGGKVIDGSNGFKEILLDDEELVEFNLPELPPLDADGL